jgi:hypothetical protein
VPADHRDTWWRMGMAVKAELGDNGIDLWLDWSSRSDSYREKDARAVWRSIKEQSNGKSVTVRSLFRAAMDHGWQPTAEKSENSGATSSGTTVTETPRQERTRTHEEPRSEPSRWSDKAEAIWSRARPLNGNDVASKYLRRRGCMPPPEDGDLRWMPATERYQWPCMLARITDAITCEPLSLHFTYLALDGSDKAPVDKQRRLLAGHVKAGGVIRLWPDDCVTYGLAVAEGIETALAAAHGFTPIWSCIDAGNLEVFPVLTGIDAITIMADNDRTGTGREAAEACARRWHEAGREVRIVMAPNVGTDMANVAAGAA